MEQDDIQYLIKSKDNLFQYTCITNLKLHNLKQYIHKEACNDEKLMELLSGLEKAYDKTLRTQSLVNGIIEYNYEQRQTIMINKEEAKYLCTVAKRTIRESLSTDSVLDDLDEYAREHHADDEGLIKLLEELDKAMKKRGYADRILNGIILYHYDEA